jgi:Hypothetical glycosyl hydrolase 6/Beta-galactosidase trimerisation domain
MDRRRFLSGATAALGMSIPAAADPKGSKEQNRAKKGQKGGGGGRIISPGGNPYELRRFVEEETNNAPKWLEWWKDNFLRVDFDMLTTDAPPEALSKIDPEDMVATIADAGLQGLWGYVQDCTGFLYYPSKIGRQHPRLNGRDLVGEYISACRKHGLKFLGYYVPNEMGLEVTNHPEWRVQFKGDTVPSSPRLWGNLCFNGPGCWDFYLSLFRESLTSYEIDAVWIDNWGNRQCCCAYCQKRYKQETGRELPFYVTPTGVDYPDKLPFGHDYPDRPEFGYYFRHIQDWIDGWAMDLRQAVKEIRPNCAILFQYVGEKGGGESGYTVKMTEPADVTTSDCAGLGYKHEHSLRFKCLRGFTRNLPFDIEMSIAEHHADEISPKQEGLLKQQFAYILAQGGGISYIDDMDWEGRISKKKYARMKKVNAWAKERFPYLGGVMVADVGLYFSHESNIYRPKWQHWRWTSPRGDAERDTKTSIHASGNVAFTQAMIRENIPFDVLHRNRLKDLSRHKVMYMNNVEVLSEEEAKALQSFVEGGGGLVVTHRTSLRDEEFQERHNFLLADLLGVDFLEKPNLATSFIFVGEGDESEGFFTGVNHEMPYFEVHDAQCYVKPRDGTRILGKVARPRRPYMEDGFAAPGRPPVMQLINPKEIRQANAGYLYAPETVTDHPAVVLHQHGKGRVAYCASYPCYDYVDDIHDLIVSLVNWAAGGELNATVTSNAPAPVEIITMEQLKKKRTVIHAINWQPDWPGVRAHDVEVGVKAFGRGAKRALAIEAKSELQLKADRDQVRLTIPSVEAWESVVIEWA